LASPIKITIQGKTARGVDAPTVGDLLSQVKDIVDVLHDVEEAVADGKDREIEWRITDVTKNSPLTFEVTPFSKRYAMNVDNRAQDVVAATSKGINSLTQGEGHPLYFSDPTIQKVEKVVDRIANGLAETIIDLSAYRDAPEVKVTRASAPAALNNLRQFISPEPIRYRELGSVEGFITKVERDGHQRPIVWLRHRIDDQTVKCVLNDKGLDRIGHYEVAEVLKGLRVQVFGLISYKGLEKIKSIETHDVHVFGEDNDLPDMEDIMAPGFTDGVEAVEYLMRLREDG